MLNKLAIIYLSLKGKLLAEKLKNFLPEAELYKFQTDLISKIWNDYDVFIFISATGIVVRCISPFLKGKNFDPGIIVIDEEGQNVISLLGGHSKQVNSLVISISTFIKANPVITTASDLRKISPLDLWIKKVKLLIKNPPTLTKVMAAFNSSKFLKIFLNARIKLPFPDEFCFVSTPNEADIIITNKYIPNIDEKRQLILIPRNLFIGIGFHDQIKEEDMENALEIVLKKGNFYKEALYGIGTLNKKINHEGLINLARKYDLKIFGFSPDELNNITSQSPPGASMKYLGISSVSEQSALLSALKEFKSASLCIPKVVFKDITLAIAEAVYQIKGKLYIIGIGPGNLENITPKAVSALRNSDLIIGYKTYINLIRSLIKDKNFLIYEMTQEIERAKLAIQEAIDGKTVSLISSGDPGIYGMCGPVLEIIAKNNLDLDITIIPGISALNACASLVGAPLMNDFVSISLSDRLISWEVIENRLHVAAQGDFVIVLYNPRSKKRKKHISKAKEILLLYKKPETPVAIIKNAFRNNQEIFLTTLEKMDLYPINMKTTIIIGNSQSFIFKNWFITPRGYEAKYGEKWQLGSDSLG